MLNDIALEKYPGLFFSSLNMDEAYPNGESPNDFYMRIKKWFSEFSSNCHNMKGNILVVTHGGVINVVYPYSITSPQYQIFQFLHMCI